MSNKKDFRFEWKNRVRRAQGLPRGAKHFASHLVDEYIFAGKQTCWPGNALIAEDLCMNIRTVQRNLKPELTAWIAGTVTNLLRRPDVSIQTLIDWQYQIATKIRAEVAAIRDRERQVARQMALFDDGAVPKVSRAANIRFDDTIYANVPTHSTGAFRFRKHLLGPDRAPLIDGNPSGEEFQCAWSLDGIDDVDV